MKTIDLSSTQIDIEIVNLLGHEYAMKYDSLPIRREDEHLYVAMGNPQNDTILDLSDITGLHIVPINANPEEVRYYINQLYGVKTMHTIASQFLTDDRAKVAASKTGVSPTSPVTRFLGSLIESGVLNRASDIHIEPFGGELRVRYRLDGRLVNYTQVSQDMLSNIISMLKIMCELDISEKRRPQDGHFTMEVLGEKVEFRLSTIPTTLGEKAAIRLLYNNSAYLKKHQLGFSEKDLERLTTLFSQPHGAIFVTGPTGSGKSTTLTSFLSYLNDPSKNIITIEEPVENPLPGISHINAQPSVGMDFATSLKYILRQDPDIIMIGEVRDNETAQMAIRAAITGHVVLSTLHTNDAPGVIERLTDMGIEPYLISAALSGVISQRLVRKICKNCITPAKLTANQAKSLGISAETPVFEGNGCGKCNQTGYHGRFAVYDYFIMNDEMRTRMNKNPAEFSTQLRKKNGLKANAIENLKNGSTTAEEIIGILRSDENL